MVDPVKKYDGVRKNGVRLSTIKGLIPSVVRQGDTIGVGNWIRRGPSKSVIGGLK
jgi:hypothetical protein